MVYSIILCTFRSSPIILQLQPMLQWATSCLCAFALLQGYHQGIFLEVRSLDQQHSLSGKWINKNLKKKKQTTILGMTEFLSSNTLHLHFHWQYLRVFDQQNVLSYFKHLPVSQVRNISCFISVCLNFYILGILKNLKGELVFFSPSSGLSSFILQF